MFARTFQLLVVACLLTGASWATNDPFVGDWKLNPSRSKLTDEMKVEGLGGNKYSFNFGGGAETVVVDGTDQPAGFGTTLSITANGPDTWKVVRKKDGRVLVTGNWVLSKDGTTLTDDFTGTKPDGSTYNLKYLYKRTAGGSGFAATWISTSEIVNSVFVLQVRPYEGEGLSFSDLSRESTKNVKFDGKDYPTQGPNVAPGSASSAHRVNERTLEMTDKINDKVIDTQEIDISSDLKTLTMTRRIVGRSEPTIFVFERQ